MADEREQKFIVRLTWSEEPDIRLTEADLKEAIEPLVVDTDEDAVIDVEESLIVDE